MTRENETAFYAALMAPTKSTWLAVADKLRIEATATPTTKSERDAYGIFRYCNHRAGVKP